MKNKVFIFGAIMVGVMAITLVPKAPGASPLYNFNWYTNVSGPPMPQGGSALMVQGSNNVLNGGVSGTNLLGFVTNTTVTSTSSVPVTLAQGANLLLMCEATAIGLGTNAVTFGFNLTPDGVNWTTTEPIEINVQLNSGINWLAGNAYGSNMLARGYAVIPWLGGFTNGSAGGTINTFAQVGTNAIQQNMTASPPLAGSYQIRWDYVSCANTTGAVCNVRYAWIQ